MELYLIFLFFIYCFGQNLVGVPDNLIHQYQGAQFTCLDGEKVISSSYVNDDYCDCRDGSDEPGTSACSNGKFWCRNTGAYSSFLPSSRVADGICDCCDGSDENYNIGKTKCENTCKQIAEAANKETRRKIEVQKRGLEYVRNAVGVYQALKEQKNKEMIKLVEQGQEVKNRITNLEEQVKLAETKLSELKTTIQESNLNKIESKLAEWVESKTKKPEMVQNTEEGENQQQENAQQQDNTQAENQQEVVEFTEEQKQDERTNIIETICGEDPDYVSQKNSVTTLQDKLRTEREEEQNFKHQIEQIIAFHNKDVGPDAKYAYLIGQKYEITADHYTYYLEPFETAKQSHTLVGSWKGWNPDYTVMLYDKGQNCWGGPDRSLEVRLVCGDTTKIIDVREESKCTYIMTMETQGACSDSELKKLEAAIL